MQIIDLYNEIKNFIKFIINYEYCDEEIIYAMYF